MEGAERISVGFSQGCNLSCCGVGGAERISVGFSQGCNLSCCGVGGAEQKMRVKINFLKNIMKVLKTLKTLDN